MRAWGKDSPERPEIQESLGGSRSEVTRSGCSKSADRIPVSSPKQVVQEPPVLEAVVDPSVDLKDAGDSDGADFGGDEDGGCEDVETLSPEDEAAPAKKTASTTKKKNAAATETETKDADLTKAVSGDLATKARLVARPKGGGDVAMKARLVARPKGAPKIDAAAASPEEGALRIVTNDNANGDAATIPQIAHIGKTARKLMRSTQLSLSKRDGATGQRASKASRHVFGKSGRVTKKRKHKSKESSESLDERKKTKRTKKKKKHAKGSDSSESESEGEESLKARKKKKKKKKKKKSKSKDGAEAVHIAFVPMPVGPPPAPIHQLPGAPAAMPLVPGPPPFPKFLARPGLPPKASRPKMAPAKAARHKMQGILARPPVREPSVLELTALIKGVYERHNPAKVDELEALLQKYAGSEKDVYLHVCRKYGEIPEIQVSKKSEALSKARSKTSGTPAKPRFVGVARKASAAPPSTAASPKKAATATLGNASAALSKLVALSSDMVSGEEPSASADAGWPFIDEPYSDGATSDASSSSGSAAPPRATLQVRRPVGLLQDFLSLPSGARVPICKGHLMRGVGLFPPSLAEQAMHHPESAKQHPAEGSSNAPKAAELCNAVSAFLASRQSTGASDAPGQGDVPLSLPERSENTGSAFGLPGRQSPTGKVADLSSKSASVSNVPSQEDALQTTQEHNDRQASAVMRRADDSQSLDGNAVSASAGGPQDPPQERQVKTLEATEASVPQRASPQSLEAGKPADGEQLKHATPCPSDSVQTAHGVEQATTTPHVDEVTGLLAGDVHALVADGSDTEESRSGSAERNSVARSAAASPAVREAVPAVEASLEVGKEAEAKAPDTQTSAVASVESPQAAGAAVPAQSSEAAPLPAASLKAVEAPATAPENVLAKAGATQVSAAASTVTPPTAAAVAISSTSAVVPTSPEGASVAVPEAANLAAAEAPPAASKSSAEASVLTPATANLQATEAPVIPATPAVAPAAAPVMSVTAPVAKLEATPAPAVPTVPAGSSTVTSAATLRWQLHCEAAASQVQPVPASVPAPVMSEAELRWQRHCAAAASLAEVVAPAVADQAASSVAEVAPGVASPAVAALAGVSSTVAPPAVVPPAVVVSAVAAPSVTASATEAPGAVSEPQADAAPLAAPGPSAKMPPGEQSGGDPFTKSLLDALDAAESETSQPASAAKPAPTPAQQAALSNLMRLTNLGGTPSKATPVAVSTPSAPSAALPPPQAAAASATTPTPETSPPQAASASATDPGALAPPAPFSGAPPPPVVGGQWPMPWGSPAAFHSAWGAGPGSFQYALPPGVTAVPPVPGAPIPPPPTTPPPTLGSAESMHWNGMPIAWMQDPAAQAMPTGAPVAAAAPGLPLPPPPRPPP